MFYGDICRPQASHGFAPVSARVAYSEGERDAPGLPRAGNPFLPSSESTKSLYVAVSAIVFPTLTAVADDDIGPHAAVTVKCFVVQRGPCSPLSPVHVHPLIAFRLHLKAGVY